MIITQPKAKQNNSFVPHLLDQHQCWTESQAPLLLQHLETYCNLYISKSLEFYLLLACRALDILTFFISLWCCQMIQKQAILLLN